MVRFSACSSHVIALDLKAYFVPLHLKGVMQCQVDM